MRQLPDKCVDLVLTDPPYNVGINYGEGTDDKIPIEEYDRRIKLLKEITPCQDWAILLGSKTETLLTWWKNFPTAKQVIIRVGASVNTQLHGFRPQYRSMLTTKKSNKWWSDLWEDIRFPGEGYFFNEERFDHPCHAPVSLMVKAIECLTEPGDLILDPFLGSGTTAVACKRTGRDFIGIEINPTYCEIARQRILQAETGVTVKEQKQGQKALFQ
jgi:site-specific DNA-methyltransferase (adenine-specific)